MASMTIGAIVLLVIALAYATVTDVRYRRIPNRLTFPMLVGGLVLRALAGGLDELLAGLAGAGAALAILLLPFALRWLGAGDVKLAMVIGALMGPDFTFTALLYAAVAAGALALVAIVRQRQLLATLKYLLFRWWLPLPRGLAPKGKIPSAPALACGCAVALLPIAQKAIGALTIL